MIEIEHFKLLLKYYFLTNKILTWLWILNIVALVSKDFLHLILMKLSQFPYHIYLDFCKYKKIVSIIERKIQIAFGSIC